MPSFNVVNYSLRPSKNIQRQLVFDGVRDLQSHIDLERLVYVGFGSVWFTDFIMAHKVLRIDDMISIESNDVGFRRATFNSPYATVQVKFGFSTEVLPSLYNDEAIKSRPWFVWLDYDYEFNESIKEDVRSLVENLPANSVLLISFNGRESKYGTAPDRPAHLRALFGDAVPDDLPKKACKDDEMQETLADYSLAFMRSVAADLARPGGFLPAFRLIYKDSTPMVTVGGVLPTKGAVKIVADRIADKKWMCQPAKRIIAPHLTVREAAVLQALLPCAESVSRERVKQLGFDLEDDQIEAFQTYYKQYPAFAQVIS
ncbi:O-methyltransferase [Mesorhizobium sophorae]|uniref:O-methyltransferase n=1 Tax=Mesorhizobium sophorae TaxID=1300294 RepID=UPI00142DE78B|nr:O-methyltransferase [Mesorhizobium sophorae]